jgi:hypothetical protein
MQVRRELGQPGSGWDGKNNFNLSKWLNPTLAKSVRFPTVVALNKVCTQRFKKRRRLQIGAPKMYISAYNVYRSLARRGANKRRSLTERVFVNRCPTGGTTCHINEGSENKWGRINGAEFITDLRLAFENLESIEVGSFRWHTTHAVAGMTTFLKNESQRVWTAPHRTSSVVIRAR